MIGDNYGAFHPWNYSDRDIVPMGTINISDFKTGRKIERPHTSHLGHFKKTIEIIRLRAMQLGSVKKVIIIFYPI